MVEVLSLKCDMVQIKVIHSGHDRYPRISCTHLMGPTPSISGSGTRLIELIKSYLLRNLSHVPELPEVKIMAA